VATPLALPSPVTQVVAPPVASTAPSATVMSGSPFGEYPANYKEIVTAWMQANGLDTSNIDWQADPKPTEMAATGGRRVSGYLVIFNTREQGQAKTRSALIRDGAVISSSGF
jgi:hypothetical protein